MSHVSPIKSAIVWALGVSGATAWRMRLENGSMSVIGVRAHGPQLIRYNAAKSNFGELLLGNDVACPIKIIDLEYAGEKNTQEEEEDIKDEYSLLIFFTFKCKHFMHMKLNKN